MTRKQPESSNGNVGLQRVLIALVAVVIIAMAIGGYYLYRTTQSNAQMVQLMSQQMTQQIMGMQEQNRMPTAEDMQEIVAGAITNIAAEEQRKIVQAKQSAYEDAATTVPEGKHIYGNLNARFTLVEFSDLECPYCKRFHDTPKKIVDGSDGNVNWEWMHLPLGFHNPAAQYGAEGSECAAEIGGNRSFWMFINEYFVQSKGGGQGANDLAKVASDVGLDANKFRECVQSARHREKVQDDLNKAQNLGVTGTPATFVVDNTTGKSQLLGGAQPAEAFIAAMRKMMAEE